MKISIPIKISILLIFSVVLVGIFISVSLIGISKDALYLEIHEKQLMLSKRIGDRIWSFVKEKRLLLQSLANDADFVDFDTTIMDSDIVRLMEQNPRYKTISVMNEFGKEMVKKKVDGGLIVNAGPVDRTFTLEFKISMRGRSYISPVFITTEEGPYIIISTPIMNINKEVAGIVLAEVSLADMWDVISGIRVGKRGYAFVVDNRGRLVAHPDKDLLMDTEKSLFTNIQLVRDAIAGKEDVPGLHDIYNSETGAKVFGAQSQIKELGWGVIVQQDHKDIMQPIKQMVRSVLIWSSIAIMLVLVISYFATHALTKPILDLSRMTKLVAKGDLTQRVKVNTRDEIGELATSFNKMLKDVQILNNALYESERKYRNIFEKAPVSIILLDKDGRMIDINPYHVSHIGKGKTVKEDYIGKNILTHPSIVNAGLSETYANVLKGGPFDLKEVFFPTTTGGIAAYLNVKGVPLLKDGDVIGAVTMHEDVTEQMRGKKRLKSQHGVTSILAESTTLKEAAPKILQAVCLALEWELGEVWIYNRQSNVLRCSEIWHVPTLEVSEFKKKTREISFAPGIGLPGRVWASGKPDWVFDVVHDSNFLRASVASDAGLHGAFSFPIISDKDTLGTILFFSQHPQEPDKDLLNMMSAIGRQIGLFIKRRQAEELKDLHANMLALNAEIGTASTRKNTMRLMLQEFTETLVKQLDVAFARIWTLNKQEMVLELQASAGMYTHIDGNHSRVPVGSFKIGLIAQECKPHMTNDVINDKRISNPEWAKREGMVAFAGHPLIVEGQVVGVMAMFAHKPLNIVVINSLAMVADKIATAIVRKQAEEQIKASLKEKEILIKEIYHRTKNNMQVICALLNMQSKYTKDEHVLTMFKEIDNRIKSMSLVHSKLYQSKDFSNINLKNYIEDLARNLFNAYNVDPDKISLNLMADDIPVTFDSAIPCGLAINEIMTNALIYAFPDNREGEIRITIRSKDNGEIELKIADNGIGVPKDFDFRKTDSLGLHIIINLIEYQLRGNVDINTENGVEYRIKFKEPYYTKRI